MTDWHSAAAASWDTGRRTGEGSSGRPFSLSLPLQSPPFPAQTGCQHPLSPMGRPLRGGGAAFQHFEQSSKQTLGDQPPPQPSWAPSLGGPGLSKEGAAWQPPVLPTATTDCEGGSEPPSCPTGRVLGEARSQPLLRTPHSPGRAGVVLSAPSPLLPGQEGRRLPAPSCDRSPWASPAPPISATHPGGHRWRILPLDSSLPK